MGLCSCCPRETDRPLAEQYSELEARTVNAADKLGRIRKAVMEKARHSLEARNPGRTVIAPSLRDGISFGAGRFSEHGRNAAADKADAVGKWARQGGSGACKACRL